MKSYLSKVIILLLSLMALVSCVKDPEVRETYIAWAIAYEVENMDYEYKLLLDDSTVLIPETSDLDYDDYVDNLDRVKVYFQINDGSTYGDPVIDANVEYMDIYDGVKDVLVQEDSVGLDTLGNDVLAVYNAGLWQSNNLLNFMYYYQYGNPPQVHSFNLVYFPDSAATKSNGIYLELRHNANNDAKTYTTKPLVSSFDMESIVPFQNVVDSVPYTIVVNPGTFAGAIERFEGNFYPPSSVN